MSKKHTERIETAIKEIERLINVGDNTCAVFHYTHGWPNQATPEQLKELEGKMRNYLQTWVGIQLDTIKEILTLIK